MDLNGNGNKDSNEYFNMIVGIGGEYQYGEATQYIFDKHFNGNGYTLSNINIDTTVNKNLENLHNIGLFGVIRKGTIKDLVIDYKGGGIKSRNSNFIINVGGFGGYIIDGTVTNIEAYANGSDSGIGLGGFAGGGSGVLQNISVNNIGNISGILSHKLGTLALMEYPLVVF